MLGIQIVQSCLLIELSAILVIIWILVKLVHHSGHESAQFSSYELNISVRYSNGPTNHGSFYYLNTGILTIPYSGMWAFGNNLSKENLKASSPLGFKVKIRWLKKNIENLTFSGRAWWFLRGHFCSSNAFKEPML